MQQGSRLTRRGFLQSAGAGTALYWRTGSAALAGIAQAACSARDEDAPWRVLEDGEAADVTAIAARIIPTTDTPGATEAGVIHFFDQALAGELAHLLPYLRRELSGFNASLGGPFASLAPDAQDAALHAVEQTPFFATIRRLTIFGFFAMSKHGGNREHVSWELIGFEGHHGAWQYPFGYYDADVHGHAGDDG